MTNSTTKPDTPRNPPFIFIGIWLAVGYWVIEAYFDSLLVENVSFIMRLYPADLHEFWMRSLTSILLIGFGVYSHRVHTRIRKAEELNVDAAWLLKNALSKTIRGHFSYCAFCRKIHNQQDQWVTPDSFIAAQTEAEFSPGICPQCQIQHSPGKPEREVKAD